VSLYVASARHNVKVSQYRHVCNFSLRTKCADMYVINAGTNFSVSLYMAIKKKYLVNVRKATILFSVHSTKWYHHNTKFHLSPKNYQQARSNEDINMPFNKNCTNLQGNNAYEAIQDIRNVQYKLLNTHNYTANTQNYTHCNILSH
jgi:hypothetical protein